MPWKRVEDPLLWLKSPKSEQFWRRFSPRDPGAETLVLEGVDEKLMLHCDGSWDLHVWERECL